jgi:hypothetical protein
MLDIVVMNHTEYLPRSQLQALELAEQKQSPKVTKNMGKRAQQKQAQQPAFTLPESMVTSNGVPTSVMSFLEVCEMFDGMVRILVLTVMVSRSRKPSLKCSCCSNTHSNTLI